MLEYVNQTTSFDNVFSSLGFIDITRWFVSLRRLYVEQYLYMSTLILVCFIRISFEKHKYKTFKKRWPYIAFHLTTKSWISDAYTNSYFEFARIT